MKNRYVFSLISANFIISCVVLANYLREVAI